MNQSQNLDATDMKLDTPKAIIIGSIIIAIGFFYE